MYFSDRVLEKMADHFQLNPLEASHFIETFRDMQLELTVKNIFIWWDQFKSPMEQVLLQKILDGMNSSDLELKAQSERKFAEVVGNQITNNLGLQTFLEERMLNFIAEMLGTYSETVDGKANAELADELTRFYPLIREAHERGYIQSRLVAKFGK
jgi:hypothetical protein